MLILRVAALRPIHGYAILQATATENERDAAEKAAGNVSVKQFRWFLKREIRGTKK